jgi:hypothetical protein
MVPTMGKSQAEFRRKESGVHFFHWMEISEGKSAGSQGSRALPLAPSRSVESCEPRIVKSMATSGSSHLDIDENFGAEAGGSNQEFARSILKIDNLLPGDSWGYPKVDTNGDRSTPTEGIERTLSWEDVENSSIGIFSST